MAISKGSGTIKRVCVVFSMVFACLCLIQTMHHPLGVAIAEGKSFVFPDISGWKQSGEIQTFSLRPFMNTSTAARIFIWPPILRN